MFELIALFLGFILWEEFVNEVSPELRPCWGCSCRVRVEGGSELVNIFTCPDSSRSSSYEGQGPHDMSGIVLELVLLTSDVKVDLL